MGPLTKKERDLMEHALGRDYPSKSLDYRNHYSSVPDDEDSKTWDSLVARGLARLAMKPCSWSEYNVYSVTDEGRAALEAT